MVICTVQIEPDKNKSETFLTAETPGGVRRCTTVEEFVMDMFDPRYQLEAEELAAVRLSPLSHEEIQHTLRALEHLAWRLHGRALLRRRRREPLGAKVRRQN